ncbi:MAG: gp16 family protein [Caulobacteraceae bacterium]
MIAPRAMVAKVKIAQKALAIDDGAYRAMLARLTGQTSAAHCSAPQLAVVLDELKAKGWSPKSPSGPARRPRLVDPPAIRKARALWISLAQIGAVRDRSDAALDSFARRQIGSALREADQARLYKLIEALKAMAERAGWSQEGDLHVVTDRLAALIEARRP